MHLPDTPTRSSPTSAPRHVTDPERPLFSASLSAHPTISDWRMCTSVTRTHGRTFYFASQLLPPGKRRAIHSAYAFCRVADDLVDNSSLLGVDLVKEKLAAWESQLHTPLDPIAVAYAHTRHRYGIPTTPTTISLLACAWISIPDCTRHGMTCVSTATAWQVPSD